VSIAKGADIILLFSFVVAAVVLIANISGLILLAANIVL